MTESNANAKKIKALYRKLIKAADEMEEDEVLEHYAAAEALGCSFSIKSSETVSWEESDGMEYATVRQDCELLLGDTVVDRWSGDYVGTYGGMGAGWWVECVGDGGIDPTVSEMLEICEVYPEDPAVPEPVRLGEPRDH